MKVSIIVPVYNVKKWLPACLDSILSQTLSDFEVLCVDDGSTDGSAEVLEEYRLRDHRIKVFHQENAGAGPARNHGLDEATGAYVVFMDPDDYYPSDDVLEKLYNAVSNNECLIAGGRLRQFFDNGGGKIRSWIAGDPFPRSGMVSYHEYQSAYWYYCYIYSRELIERNHLRFPSYRRFQDPPFFIRAMLAAHDFFAMEDVVYCWRTSHHQIDWEANDCRLLREHLSGALEVLRLAEENGLDRMFYKIAKQAFKLVESAYALNRVYDIAKLLIFELRNTQHLSTLKKFHLIRYLLRKECAMKRMLKTFELWFRYTRRRSLKSAKGEDPLVSVIIPIYNAERYLEKCLDSILRQSLANIEILCVDDGSTDSSMRILQEIAQGDARIKIISQTNLGAGHARNIGLACARGRYLFFADSDDYMLSSYLRDLYETAEKYNADVVAAPWLVADAAGKIVSKRKIPRLVRKRRCPFYGRELGENLYCTFGPQPWNKLVKRILPLRHGYKYQCIPRNNDIFFSDMSLTFASRIAFVKKPGYVHRIGHGGNLQSNNDKSPFAVFEAYAGLRDALQAHGLLRMNWSAFVKAADSSYRVLFGRLRDPNNLKEFERKYEEECKAWKRNPQEGVLRTNVQIQGG